MKKVILALNNVSLALPTVEKPIINNMDYQAYEGDFIVILGSNGSGKSSLLKLISGQHQATSGHITRNVPGSVKTLTQNCHESLFTALTVLENYLIVKQAHSKKLFATSVAIERDFFAYYLVKFNPALATKLDQLVGQLSGGEQQALALALTVLYPPRILLLDEHTSALDPKTAERLMELTHEITQEFRITCFLTTHDLTIAKKYGNRVLALRHGSIHRQIDHAAKNNLSQQGLLAACY
jgi:putative tryptophan/tyrosine transport system ATP-binding protein